MKDVDLIITARWVIPVEVPATVLEYHTVVVHQGRIEAILPHTAALQVYRCAQPIERMTHVLLPGLINAYTQAGSMLLRAAAGADGTASGSAASLALLEQRFVDPDFTRDATQLAIGAMLCAGITCFADADLYPQIVAQTAAAAQMRVCVGLQVRDEATHWAQCASEYLEKGLQIRDEYRDDPLITTAFAPVGAAQVSDATLTRIRRAADEIEAPILLPMDLAHTSGAEPRFFKRLEQLGLLTPLLAAIHPAALERCDVEAAANAGINAVHCARETLSHQRGFGAVGELLAHGLNIGIGTGGAQAGSDIDVLQQMRLTALQGGATLSPHDVIRMGTLNGARALGIDTQTGSISVGKWADLCCIDLHNLQTQPLYDPAMQLVHAATRDQVSDVWVAGRHLLRQRQLTRMDLSLLLHTAAQWGERIAMREVSSDERIA